MQGAASLLYEGGSRPPQHRTHARYRPPRCTPRAGSTKAAKATSSSRTRTTTIAARRKPLPPIRPVTGTGAADVVAVPLPAPLLVPDVKALASFVPSGLPQPVQASHPGPAAYPPMTPPVGSFVPLVTSWKTPAR